MSKVVLNFTHKQFAGNQGIPAVVIYIYSFGPFIVCMHDLVSFSLSLKKKKKYFLFLSDRNMTFFLLALLISTHKEAALFLCYIKDTVITIIIQSFRCFGRTKRPLCSHTLLTRTSQCTGKTEIKRLHAF